MLYECSCAPWWMAGLRDLLASCDLKLLTSDCRELFSLTKMSIVWACACREGGGERGGGRGREGGERERGGREGERGWRERGRARE